jgi:hypothetical protein
MLTVWGCMASSNVQALMWCIKACMNSAAREDPRRHESPSLLPQVQGRSRTRSPNGWAHDWSPPLFGNPREMFQAWWMRPMATFLSTGLAKADLPTLMPP